MILVQNADGKTIVFTEHTDDSTIYIWLSAHKSYDELPIAETDTWCQRLTDHIIGEKVLSRSELAEAHRDIGMNLMELGSDNANTINCIAGELL